MDKENGAKWLRIEAIPNQIVMFPFRGHSHSEAFVKAQSVGNDYYFETTKGEKLFWLADMKAKHAQFEVGNLASRMGTMGIDEFEWLRMKKKS